MDLAKNVEFDLWLRYVSALAFTSAATTAPIPVPSYLTLDTRVAWKPWSRVELALVGQNLLQRGHQEFLSQQVATQATQVGRSVYGKVTWQY